MQIDALLQFQICQKRHWKN